MEDRSEIKAQVAEQRQVLLGLLEAVKKRLVGQDHVMKRLVMGMLCRGHVLLEGLPGLAKTTAVKAMGDASDLQVSRIQFTPDLLPADVVGTQIYDPRQNHFTVKKGPIFANLVIADEINRAPAKVQSALLEAMQERQVTIGDESFALPEPFLVMATQNPIEQEGTYTLPEAQTDRFLFKVKVGYLQPEQEKAMLELLSHGEEAPLAQAITGADVLRIRALAEQIHVADPIRDYIIRLVFATRSPSDYGLKNLDGQISYGASPRASINFEKAARIGALLDGRDYVSPQDIKDVAIDILRHRILTSYEAEADGITSEDVVQQILDNVDVP